MTRFQILLVAALLLVASAAYGQTECVTRCGMRAPNVDCEALRETETRVLHALSVNVEGWDYDSMCTGLSDWRIFALPQTKQEIRMCQKNGGFLVGRFSKCLGGYVHVFSHEIQLHAINWTETYLAHELIHVFQVVFGEDVGHCDWIGRGIWKALREATGTTPRYEPGPCGPISDLENYRP